MRRALLAAGAMLALAPAAAPAQEHHGAGPQAGAVTIGYAAFEPAVVDVLAGDSIRWANDSVRRHDVAAVDGSFDSGILGAGAAFARTFAPPGDVVYYCTIHPFMRGAIGVRELLVDAPTEPAVPGRPFPLHGRTSLAPGAPVTIEADEGSGYLPVAATSAQEDGTFTAELRAHVPAQLRAVSGAAASPPVQLLVLDRAVAASVRMGRGREHVGVRVTPPGHGGTVVLQLRLRERFGWWPVGRAMLDHRGRATFTIRRPRRVRARVVLTLADGATPLAISPEVRLGR